MKYLRLTYKQPNCFLPSQTQHFTTRRWVFSDIKLVSEWTVICLRLYKNKYISNINFCSLTVPKNPVISYLTFYVGYYRVRYSGLSNLPYWADRYSAALRHTAVPRYPARLDGKTLAQCSRAPLAPKLPSDQHLYHPWRPN
jgi:hypothetical protein